MTFEQYEQLKAISNGDKKCKRHIPYEEELQMRCVEWFDRHFPRLKMCLHHSPNGGRRSQREGAKFKRMGVRAGFPDLIWLVPIYDGDKYIPYYCIEMKYGKGRQEEVQKEYEKYIKQFGGEYIIVRTFEEFKKRIVWLLYRTCLDTLLPLTEQETRELEMINKSLYH